MKKSTKFMTLIMSILMLGTAISGTGCKKEETFDENTIAIYAFDSGYGTQWIEDIGAAYTAKNPGVKVVVKDSSLRDVVDAALINETNYDLIFKYFDCHFQAFLVAQTLKNLPAMQKTLF